MSEAHGSLEIVPAKGQSVQLIGIDFNPDFTEKRRSYPNV